MTIINRRILAGGIALLGGLGSARPLTAQLGVGTWVRRAKPSMSTMTMVVEACCNGGRRLIYHLDMNGTKTIMTVESRFDGSSAPVLVNGKPSGQTMEIKRIDDHHIATVIKLSGKQLGTSQATLSADGKTLTVVNDFTSAGGGQIAGKTTEIWVRK